MSELYEVFKVLWGGFRKLVFRHFLLSNICAPFR